MNKYQWVGIIGGNLIGCIIGLFILHFWILDDLEVVRTVPQVVEVSYYNLKDTRFKTENWLEFSGEMVKEVNGKYTVELTPLFHFKDSAITVTMKCKEEVAIGDPTKK